MKKHFAVLDVETTWKNHLMSVGIVIADSKTMEPIGYRYYVVTDTLKEGGIYYMVVHLDGIEETETTLKKAEESIRVFLRENDVDSIFAFNAGFDKSVLNGLSDFDWYDILKIAAYRQHNPFITDEDECCKTGRLKGKYGVETLMQKAGKKDYREVHNGLCDALDELELMRLVGQPIKIYQKMC